MLQSCEQSWLIYTRKPFGDILDVVHCSLISFPQILENTRECYKEHPISKKWILQENATRYFKRMLQRTSYKQEVLFQEQKYIHKNEMLKYLQTTIICNLIV